jgi:heme exporter protein A
MSGGVRPSVAEPLLVLGDFGCERDGRWLFRNLTLALLPGECLELVGPNGSGKSTLLRAITGLYPEFVGTLRVAECLYLGHRPGISGVLTAAENLRWYAALQGSGQGSGQGALCSVTEALEQVGMAGYDNVLCQQLSAGQQRRVGLARLLLGGGRLWLLDEPLTALDSAGQQLVRGLLDGHLARGGAAVCATHQPLGVAGARQLSLGPALEPMADLEP